MEQTQTRLTPADHFCELLRANVDNKGFTDAQFRDLVRKTLPVAKTAKK